jgi:hypothetical protein
MHQILKLPALVSHFAEHTYENLDMTLIDFIVIHYFNDSTKDDDYEKDMRLPFKTVECAASVTLAIIQMQPFSAVQPVILITNSYPSLRNSSIRFNPAADIWQPPKFS